MLQKYIQIENIYFKMVKNIKHVSIFAVLWIK